MADSVTEILLRARGDFSDLTGKISGLRKEFQNLKLPKDITANLEKGFNRLDPILKSYQKQLDKGFKTKTDLKNFEATRHELDAIFSDITSEIQKVNGQPVQLKADLKEITALEKKLDGFGEKLQKALDKITIKEGGKVTNEINKLVAATSKASTIKPMTIKAQDLFNQQDFVAFNNEIDKIQNKILNLSNIRGAKVDLAKAIMGPNFTNDVEAMDAAIKRFFNDLKVSEKSMTGLAEINNDITKTGQALNQVKTDSLTRGVQALSDFGVNAQQASQQAKGLGDSIDSAASSSVRMADELQQLKTSTQYFFSLRNMINLFKRGVSEAVDVIKELDAAMTETAVVTDFSVGDMWKKLPEYTANANALGASVKDMYEATTLYYQQGLETDAAMGIANETMKMARIGGLDAADATDKMTAALRGFNMTLDETSAQRVNDVYSNLAAKTASDTEELGTAMQRTASIAASAGMSFEGTAAFLAQAIETTREPAENLGTAMKTIVARFTELKKNPLEISEVDGEEVDYNKVDTALKSIGVSLKDANGQFRNLDQVFLDIAQRWDGLTQTQQRYVATQAAGSRQQSRFIAMMSNYERTVELMDYANNSAGASNEQFGKTMESLEAKLNKLKNAWNEFLMGIMNDSMTKFVVDAGTKLLGLLNDITDVLSFGGKSGLLKSITSLTAAFIGLKTAGKLINFGVDKAGSLLNPNTPLLGFGGGHGEKVSKTTTTIVNPIVAEIRQVVAAIKGQSVVKAEYDKIGTVQQYKNSQTSLRTLLGLNDKKFIGGAKTNPQRNIKYSEITDNLKGLSGDQQRQLLGTLPGLQQAMRGATLDLLKNNNVSKNSQKLGQQITKDIIQGMNKGTISVEKGIELLRNPQKWGQTFGNKFNAGNLQEIASSVTSPEFNKLIEEAQDKYAQAVYRGQNADRTWLTNEEIAARQADFEKYAKRKSKDKAPIENIDYTKYSQLGDKIGQVGANFAVAGQSVQQFGIALSNLGLEKAGALLMQIGSSISSLGMAFNGLGTVLPKIQERFADAGAAAVEAFGAAGKGVGGVASGGGAFFSTLFGSGAAAAAAGIGVAAVAAIAIQKYLEKKAKEAGEEVRKQFEEKFTKADEKINSLEGYESRFNELAKGVDQFGHNVSLTSEEYSEYLNISRELQQLSPSLIAGYNAEGEAIIKKGTAIQDVINKLKKEKQAELESFTSNSSINKLIGEYQTSDAYKEYHNDITAPISRGYSNFTQERIDISNLKDGNNLISAINQLSGWSLDSLNNLTTAQLSWLSKHYNDVINLVEEQNGTLEDEVREGYIDAFTNAGSAINDVMTEGKPIIDAMQMWMGDQKLDAVGLGLGEEFSNSFNQGVEGIMLTGLTEGWTSDQFKDNLRNYSDEWDDLAGSTSKYTSIIKEAKDIQDQYLDSIGSDTAIEQYNTDITDSCNKLIELANNTDTATAAGQAFQQQCIAQASALRNYATEGGVALSQALNTATDDLQQAEAALDNFNEATKTDLYTAAEGMKSIYDKAFETYKDSFGGEYEKHFESKGDRTAWEAGRTILGEDALKSIPDGQALRKRLKEWEPALREGEEGWYNFWTKITGDAQLMDNLNAIDGVRWDEDDFYIPDDKWAEVAKTIGISEEMLTAMLNKGRQFADISFTNWGEARHTLETSGVGIEGTAGTEKNGQRKLFIKEETFEAALADANYKPEEYEAKKQEGREKQNLEYLKSANEYNSQQLSKIFREEMGIGSLTDLVSTLSASGDYTKDEIEAYAEKAGFKGDFDSIYDKVAEAIENPELYKQTSVLEKISSQIALLSEDNNITADDALSDRNKFAKELYGNLGKDIDSEADYFAHGQDKEGNRITVEEYEATKKSLEAQRAWAEQQASMAQAKATNASNPEEQAKWLEVADKYSQDAENIGTYITMGIAAFEASEQEKSTLTQQATEQAKALVASNASNEQIKASMQEAAQKMAEAKMKPEDIAAALNKSYGTNLTGKDVNIGQDGKVGLTLDESKLQEQLSNLHADIEANITSINMGGGGHAARASGQNNPNSIFRRHGTMARGSSRGYIISGRPTLTGEEGEELVWEPKRNEAYMVGSNGPQFANISKDAIVWNAAQTKRIKKNSKVGSFGTGARGISRFGTMAGGTGLKIPGTLDVDAKATIQDITLPEKEFTIPAKVDLQDKTAIEDIDATATVTRVEKAAKVSGEPIQVQATASTTKVDKASKPKVSAGTQTMNVTANTGAAQAKINQLINVFKKTYTLKYRASGPSSIKVPISADFRGSWKKTVEISKGSGANGINNRGFGSLAGGKGRGTVGPNNRGGLTLTGEKGFEIAWLPSENRSMILGANGPQMLNLPKDVVVWNHKQSKKILKQKTIPAGSQATAGGHYNASGSRYNFTGGSNSSVAQSVKKTSGSVKKSATDAAAAVKKVSVWWENIARKTELAQRIQDKNQKAFEKYLKEMRATLRTTGESLKSGGGGGDDYLTSIGKTLGYYEAQLEKVNKELKNLDTAWAPTKQKDREKLYGQEGHENIVQVSYKNGKNTKEDLINLAGYIKQEDGTYVVDQKALDKIANKDLRKAVADAANKEINDRLSKKYKAEDEIEKAQEAIEKMGEELYKTFFGWEVELTKIWNITQKIEQTEARISQFKGYSDLLESQLSTGMAKAGKDFAAQSLQAFQAGLQQQMRQIDLSLQSLDQKRTDLSNLISLDDEKETLTNIQNKLIENIKAQDQIATTEAQMNKAKAASDKATKDRQTVENRQKSIVTEINNARKQTQTGSKSARKKAAQKLAQLLKEQQTLPDKLATAKNTEAAAIKAYENAKTAYENAGKGATLNDTEKLGYEEYAKELEKTISTQAKAWEFMTATQMADGTVNVTFDSEAFEAEKFAGNITEEQGKAIQDYVKSIVDESKSLSQQYVDATSLINDMYGSLGTLQDSWADYANKLWDISEAEQKKEVENFKKLSDSITNALKNLLDEVKRKLDERRQQEDNAKTERDISQKQQRLAMLRADTAGGHQVEIAQLEQEIADAQQSYQRTLEDQLLDKLQQQADLAAEQRERQIALQEATISEINNAAQVDLWMSSPEAYKDEIYEAFKQANDYDKKPAAIQAQLDRDFNTLFNGLLTNQQEQALITDGIKTLEGQVEQISAQMSEFAHLSGAITALVATITQTGSSSGTSTINKPTDLTSDQTTANRIEATVEALKPQTSAQSQDDDKTAKEKAYRTTIDAIHKAKKIDKTTLKDVLAKGTQAGYKWAQVAYDLAAGDGQGGISWAAVIKAAKKAGYKKDLVAQWSPKTGQPQKDFQNAFKKWNKYASGGLADYTGPAWLDGTPSRPELILNKKDTQNFLALRDVLSSAMKSTGAVTNSYGGDVMYDINIHVDKIEKDYDVDRVVDKVKKEIVKGAGYRNVTQVRNFK